MQICMRKAKLRKKNSKGKQCFKEAQRRKKNQTKHHCALETRGLVLTKTTSFLIFNSLLEQLLNYKQIDLLARLRRNHFPHASSAQG